MEPFYELLENVSAKQRVHMPQFFTVSVDFEKSNMKIREIRLARSIASVDYDKNAVTPLANISVSLCKLDEHIVFVWISDRSSFVPLLLDQSGDILATSTSRVRI
jgi:hypothetical protein